MKIRTAFVVNVCKMVTVIAALVIASIPMSVSAAPIDSTDIKRAQTIMNKFGIPAGPVDGKMGPKTRRGLCAFRYMAGLPVSRSTLGNTATDPTLDKLEKYNKTYGSLTSIPARNISGATTYVVVQETCQVMFYAESGRYQRVMATSTGDDRYDKDRATPNNTYNLDYTKTRDFDNTGWTCSTIYPESCSHHPGVGRFATSGKTYGNMYNKRRVVGGIFVHGSTSVPTYPASHGCIRVTPADADWMYDHVGNDARPKIIITGAYKW